MSSIRWHFEDVTLSMGGRERHWMAAIATNVAEGVIRLRKPFDSIVSIGWSMAPGTFASTIETAWEMGSKPVKLATYIHGFCETNTVIDGDAFDEVADTLEEGLTLGIFRPETQSYEGIENIIPRLRKGGNWCAWSYSVTDGFPRYVGYDDDSGDKYLTAEETVALIRSEGNVAKKGFLGAPLFDGAPSNKSFLRMHPTELKELTCR